MWRVAGGRYRAAGSVRLDQVAADWASSLPEGDYDTLGGYLLARLGRIPEPGDTTDLRTPAGAAWRLRVVTMDGLRVGVVALETDGAPTPEPD